MLIYGAVLLLLIVATSFASAFVYFGSKPNFRRWAEESRLVTEDQLNALSTTIKILEARVTDLNNAVAARPMPVSAPVEAEVIPAPRTASAPHEEISPELLVVIAAAVTVFLGKKVRIRSAKRLQSPYEIINPWAQQGRVIVQASHNPRGGF